jgi:GDPmannose 4,6-dehydratase
MRMRLTSGAIAHIRSWSGEGLEEVGINADTGDIVIRIDPNYYRPTEVHYLCGDASKAQRVLGWHSKTTFKVYWSVANNVCIGSID